VDVAQHTGWPHFLCVLSTQMGFLFQMGCLFRCIQENKQLATLSLLPDSRTVVFYGIGYLTPVFSTNILVLAARDSTFETVGLCHFDP
jgi:hypothetical protein